MASILGDPEALVAEVSKRAHHRAVEIAEDSRRRAAATLDEAREESESIRRQAAQNVERQTALALKRNAALAELEAQRRFILLREAPINRVWQAAEQRLRDAVHQPVYLDILKRCALEAARELDTGDLVLAADPIGHKLLAPDILTQWSSEAGTLFQRAPEPAATWGGLLVTSGRSRFDATFPTQLLQAQVALRDQVFQILSKGIT